MCYRPCIGNSDSGIREVFVCGNLESGKFKLWNPESWALDSRIQPMESRIPLTMESGIQNPSSLTKDVESNTWSAESKCWVYESKVSPMIFNWVVSPYSIPLQNLLNQSGLTKIYSPLLIGHINMSANNLQFPAQPFLL